MKVYGSNSKNLYTLGTQMNLWKSLLLILFLQALNVLAFRKGKTFVLTSDVSVDFASTSAWG